MKTGHLDPVTGKWVDETPAADDAAFAAEQATHPPVGGGAPSDPLRQQSGAAITSDERAAAGPGAQVPLSAAEKARTMQFIRGNAGNPAEVAGAREVLLRGSRVMPPSPGAGGPPVAIAPGAALPGADNGVALKPGDIGLRDQTTPVGGPGLASVPGNVDLTNRPDTANPDGSHSSVRSMSFSETKGGPEILIPTVAEDGRVLTEEEAIAQYKKTGKHLGQFPDVAAANAYADQLHRQQAGELNAPQPAVTSAERAREIQRRRGTTLTGVR